MEVRRENCLREARRNAARAAIGDMFERRI